jgi:hypothetical protein
MTNYLNTPSSCLTSHKSSESNTNAIVNQAGHTTSAAKLCDDYTNPDYGTGVFSDSICHRQNTAELRQGNQVVLAIKNSLKSSNRLRKGTDCFLPFMNSASLSGKGIFPWPMISSMVAMNLAGWAVSKKRPI